ncbi:MAG TPA: SAM hydrolase/SAM-dependent halogenase family protein [Candidatus Brocadiaceae bacterium]
MRHPSLITLLTDFGSQDAYVGIVKGVIAGINPSARIIDICHEIPPQDVFRGAYLLYTSYKYFPKGTIHTAVVDPGVGGKRDIVCVKIRDYFFLVPNNGILSFILQEELPEEIVRITNTTYFLQKSSRTFHGRDIFAPIAAYISCGVKPQQLGTHIQQLNKLDIPEPIRTKMGHIIGQIISIDRFGNLITNITKKHVRDLKTAEKYLKVTIGKRKITGLSTTYVDVETGKPLILFGSTGFLEVSVNQGNAQEYFKAGRGNKIAANPYK